MKNFFRILGKNNYLNYTKRLRNNGESLRKSLDNCLDIIKDIVEWQHFKTWFEPIKPVALKEKVLTIQVPSQFFYEYLEEHYVNFLAKTLKRELGKEARLEYRIMVDSGNSNNKPLTMDVPGHGYKSYSNNEMDFPLVINNPVKNPFVIPGLKKMQIDPQLNPVIHLIHLLKVIVTGLHAVQVKQLQKNQAPILLIHW